MPWGNIDQSGTTAGSKRADGSARTSNSAVAAAILNRQIRSLLPGQTIRGEVLSRNGSDVQIKLADDMVLQAKIDQSMNLEVGKSMTFEVRNNGSALTLSPLFENMSADVNVLKALDMAGLPVNEASVAMTSRMMEAGLSVDRNSLQQVYREIVSFPQAEVSDIVNLHKLGLAVNETNIDQMISYRNLTHQLLDGMETVLGALPDTLEAMAAEGNLQGLVGLYQELFDLVQEGTGEVPDLSQEVLAQETIDSQLAEEGLSPEGSAGLQDAVSEAAAHVGSTPEAAAEILLEGFGAVGGNGGDSAAVQGLDIALQPESAIGEGTAASSTGALPIDASSTGDSSIPASSTSSTSSTGVSPDAAAGSGDSLSAASRQVLSEQLLNVLSELPMGLEEAEHIAMQLRQFEQGSLSREEFFAAAGRMLLAARTAEGGVQNLHRIFAGGEFKSLLTESLKSLWLIEPEELEEPGKVEDLYRRMDRQLKSLTQVLENGGQAESSTYRAAAAMTQNIDFLNQLNQIYTYIQLPLHLSQGEAHGDLYVYANKKNLAAKDGKISALLHLDMEHLGPVDVYVSMEMNKVNTKFYVKDDEMLDFLEAHMHILTERLAKRGYDCNVSMTARDKKAAINSGILPILEQEKGMLVTQYAFDVRT